MKPDLTINGIPIRADTDFHALVRDQLKRGHPLASKDDFGNQDGVLRLLEATAGTDLEPKVFDAVMAALRDGDPEVRSGAVCVVGNAPDLFRADLVLGALEANPSLYEGVASPGDDADLEARLLSVLGRRAPGDPRVVAGLRKKASDPVRGAPVVGALTFADPAWVAEHAKEVMAGRPDRAVAVLWNLRDDALRARFLQGLAGESQDFRARVRDGIRGGFSDPQERDRLLSALA